MSIQNAVSFVDKASTDDRLREQVAQVTADKDPEQKAAAVAELGKSIGLDFTPAEMIQVRAVVRKALKETGQSDEELDELDLQAVSGGVGHPNYISGSDLDYGGITGLPGMMPGPPTGSTSIFQGW